MITGIRYTDDEPFIMEFPFGAHVCGQGFDEIILRFSDLKKALDERGVEDTMQYIHEDLFVRVYPPPEEDVVCKISLTFE